MTAETYTDRVLSLPALAYWKCDEASGSLADLSKGNTAVVSGAPAYGVAGPFVGAPTAISLPGVNTNYFTVTVPNGAPLDTADVFSIGWWVKPTLGAIMEIAVRPINGYDFRINADGKINLTKTFISSLLTAASSVASGVWSFVGVTKNGANATLYINGLPVGTSGGLAAIQNNVGNVVIGRNAQDGSLPFNGAMGRGFISNIALTDAQWLVLYQSAIAGPATEVTTTVIWREPTPPHAAIYVTEPGAVTYQQRLRGAGSAALLVPRTDSNASGIAKLLARCVPMVTIERSDGLLPFVGFAIDPAGGESDTHMQLTLADHTLRLSQASTRLVAESRQASGTMLAAELRDMDVRAEPPLYLDLRYVSQGPSVSLALTGQNGDSFLRELERQTGYEAYFTYAISTRGVTTYLQWRQQQGQDRRAEDSWRGGDQLADVRYAIDNRLGLKAATSVGGTGAVSARASATANATGNRSLGATVTKVAAPARGIGGTRVDFLQTVTDATVLKERSKQALIDPRNSPVRWEFGLVESKVDMTRVGVGDIRVLGSETAFLGQPVEGVARIIAMELHPAEGVHRCVAVGVD